MTGEVSTMGTTNRTKHNRHLIELPIQNTAVKVWVWWDGIWVLEIEEDQVKYWYSLFPGLSRRILENKICEWMQEQYELHMIKTGRPIPTGKYGRVIIHLDW